MNLLTVGESLSIENENGIDKSWVEIVKSKSHVKLYNKTVRNCQSKKILEKLDDYIRDLDLKTIFLICGTEDALLNKTPNHIFKNVTNVIDQCTLKGITAIVIMPPLFNVELFSEKSKRPVEELSNALTSLKRYRRLIEDYCIEGNIGIIDFQKSFQEMEFQALPEKHFTDGIHLTDYAHEVIAEKFIYKYNHILSNENKKNNFTNININTIKQK